MNDQPSSEKTSPKQAYSKPTLRAIELVTDQVLGVGCKTDTSSGPSSGEFGSCLTPAPCQTDGS